MGEHPGKWETATPLVNVYHFSHFFVHDFFQSPGGPYHSDAFPKMLKKIPRLPYGHSSNRTFGVKVSNTNPRINIDMLVYTPPGIAKGILFFLSLTFRGYVSFRQSTCVDPYVYIYIQIPIIPVKYYLQTLATKAAT